MLIAFYSDIPGCGKTTAANFLVDNFQFQKLSFAAIMNDMLAPLLAAFNYDITEVDQPQAKNLPLERIPGQPSLRLLKQTLGTEWGRKIVDKHIWVAAMESKLNRLLDIDIDTNIVIDDMRFPNELEMLDQFPTCRLVKLHRDTQPLAFKELKHPSNFALAHHDFEWNIFNDSTEYQFKRELEDMIMTPPY